MTDERDTFEDAELGHRRVTARWPEDRDKAIRSIPKPMPMHDNTTCAPWRSEPGRVVGRACGRLGEELNAIAARHQPLLSGLSDAYRATKAVPMAGGTPADFEAKDSPTLAAEMLRRLADSRWADGHRDTDPLHAAAEMLSRESRPSPGERAAAEVEAELAEITGARVAIRQARYTASRFKAGNPATVERHALHLLGYNGDTESELFEDIKRTADLGNVVSRELLRQDKAAKRAVAS